MKHYFKILLLSVGIGVLNFVLYDLISQIKIIINNSAEAFLIYAFVLGVPVQFLILALVSIISKKNKKAIWVAAGLSVVLWLAFHWFATIDERNSYNQNVIEKKLYSTIEQKDYKIGISTPKGYPIKLISDGRLAVIIQGKSYYTGRFETNKVYSEEWGNISIGGGGKAVPDSLKLFWYSFVENKYYGLKAEVDKNKISDYFKKGYKREEWDNTKKSTQYNKADYEELVVGIAPGGDVVLWIAGGRDIREIGVFKAKEIKANQFETYDVVKEKEIKEVMSENSPQSRKIVNRNKPIPYEIWTNKYRNTFNWKVDINLLDQSKSALELFFYNGERYSLYNEEVTQLKHKLQVLPNSIVLNFEKNKKNYNAFFEFDEDEIFNHFEKLSRKYPKEPIDIVINISPDLTQTTIELKSKERSINFIKMKTVKITAD